MLFILDTDLVTILQLRSQPAFDRLQARLQAQAVDDVVTTIITFQEKVQGWMSLLHQTRTPRKILWVYRELLTTLRYFCAVKVLSFDQAAQDHVAALKQQRLRIGTLDLRIASIAMAMEATLLSRNLRAFRKVFGLKVEDWTQ
jgi:tRNA(fMet)-specific endonuclease VapC